LHPRNFFRERNWAGKSVKKEGKREKMHGVAFGSKPKNFPAGIPPKKCA